MASGPYDLGPFQTLSAINFAQGDIFGRISSVLPRSQVLSDPLAAGSSCSFLIPVPLTWTPTRTFPDESMTRVLIQIFVGEDWKNSPLNPFSPELSNSPGSTALDGFNKLASSTVTHVDSGQSFVTDDDATAGKICDLGADLAGFYPVTYATTLAQIYTNPVAPFQSFTARRQYWIWSVTDTTIGQSNELWVGGFYYVDVNDPAINTAPFWDVASVNDKVTLT